MPLVGSKTNDNTKKETGTKETTVANPTVSPSLSSLSDMIEQKRISQVQSFRKSIISDIKIDIISFNDSSLDANISIGTGLNLFYGVADTGKTNTALHLAFNKLEIGDSVIYYDLEGGVDPERLKQIYKHRNDPFPYEKLVNNFVVPDKFEWDAVLADFKRIVTVERPRLFIIDAFTPLFMKDFNDPSKERGKWKLTNEREFACITLWSEAYRNNITVIVIAHAKTMKGKNKEDVNDQLTRLISEPELFTGIGNRFEFMGKNWIYFMKVVDERNNQKRYMVQTKRKVGQNFYESKKKVGFKITDTGISSNT